MFYSILVVLGVLRDLDVAESVRRAAEGGGMGATSPEELSIGGAWYPQGTEPGPQGR